MTNMKISVQLRTTKCGHNKHEDDSVQLRTTKCGHNTHADDSVQLRTQQSVAITNMKQDQPR